MNKGFVIYRNKITREYKTVHLSDEEIKIIKNFQSEVGPTSRKTILIGTENIASCDIQNRKESNEIQSSSFGNRDQEDKEWRSHINWLRHQDSKTKMRWDLGRLIQIIRCFEIKEKEQEEIIQSLKQVTVDWFEENPKRTKLDGSIMAEIMNGYKINLRKMTMLEYFNKIIPKRDKELIEYSS